MLQPASHTFTHAIPTGLRLRQPLSGPLSGLGDAPSQATQDLQRVTANAASTGASIATALLLVVHAGSLVPIVGAAVAAAAAIAIVIEKVFSGCGQTCIEATNIANQVAAKLNENVQNYFAQNPRYASVQVAALAVFDQTWNLLLQACGNPALGSAGQRCISERQRGGVAPWCPNPGHTGCDWFILFRDPIANDPNVQPDPSPTPAPAPAPAPAGSQTVILQPIQNPDGSTSYVQVQSSGGSLPIPLLLGAAALILGLVFSTAGDSK